jgi:N-formylglutamate amidohydrolase
VFFDGHRTDIVIEGQLGKSQSSSMQARIYRAESNEGRAEVVNARVEKYRYTASLFFSLK